MASPSLSSLFLCFLKIGCVSFGGFMSLVSMIENQVVEKRKWLSEEDMLDGIALANLLPGPMAVNTVAYVGYRLRGGAGALLAAVAVLLPTTLLMIGLTHLYFLYGTLPTVERIFAGILPAVAAIVLNVCLKMAGKNLKSRGTFAACAFVVLLLLVLPRALRAYATFGLVALYGIAGCLLYRYKTRHTEPVAHLSGNEALSEPSPKLRRSLQRSRIIGFGLLGVIALLGIVPLPAARDGLVSLMTTFGSMSLTLFGGGYVFIPMIQEVVVDRFGWLTAKEFVDGIALGQITPGPILISALFIGQKVAGIPGALLSTLAIFAPPATLMVLLAGMLEELKRSRMLQAALKGIRVAVIGLIFGAFLSIFRLAWPHGEDGAGAAAMVLAVFLLSFAAQFRYKVDIIWIIPVAGGIGFFFG
ncbi:MAG TPA: chromate efflux transporter [Pontiella sp.]|nr:chromate efflux transporter [Pontiella sp.]